MERYAVPPYEIEIENSMSIPGHPLGSKSPTSNGLSDASCYSFGESLSLFGLSRHSMTSEPTYSRLCFPFVIRFVVLPFSCKDKE